MFPSYAAAAATLPPDVRFTASFGWAGVAGYSEYHTAPDGTRYVIDNGPWHGDGQRWDVTRIEKA